MKIRQALARDTDAVDKPLPVPGPLDAGAQRLQRLRGVDDVFALEQSADPGRAHRKRAENKRPDRDRLVARYARGTRQGAVTASGQRSGMSVHERSGISVHGG